MIGLIVMVLSAVGLAAFTLAVCIAVASPVGGHALVLLRDGTVLDPNDDAQKRLSDLPKVGYIAGIFRVRDPFPSEPVTGLHWTDGKGNCQWCGAANESYGYHDPCPARQGLATA